MELKIGSMLWYCDQAARSSRIYGIEIYATFSDKDESSATMHIVLDPVLHSESSYHISAGNLDAKYANIRG